MQEPFLTGNTVYLRGLEREDLKLIKKWFSNEKVTHYLEMGEMPYSLEQLTTMYEQQMNEKNDIQFIVMDKINEKPIGLAGLYRISWVHRFCEIRVFLGEPKYWKMSASLESLKLLVEYGFDKLNLHRIAGGANVENKSSWKVLERLGFVKEGEFREVVYRNGQYYNLYMYGLLESDYKKNQISKNK